MTTWLQKVPITDSTKYTTFVVSTLGGANGPFYNGNDTANGYGFYRGNTADYGLKYGGQTDLTFGPAQKSGFQLQEAVSDGTVTTFYHNGRRSGKPITVTPLAPGASDLSSVGGISATQLFQGNIAAVVVFDHALSQAERQQVERYLTQKYNL